VGGRGNLAGRPRCLSSPKKGDAVPRVAEQRSYRHRNPPADAWRVFSCPFRCSWLPERDIMNILKLFVSIVVFAGLSVGQTVVVPASCFASQRAPTWADLRFGNGLDTFRSAACLECDLACIFSARYHACVSPLVLNNFIVSQPQGYIDGSI